jgi:hypothetical protein
MIKIYYRSMAILCATLIVCAFNPGCRSFVALDRVSSDPSNMRGIFGRYVLVHQAGGFAGVDSDKRDEGTYIILSPDSLLSRFFDNRFWGSGHFSVQPDTGDGYNERRLMILTGNPSERIYWADDSLFIMPPENVMDGMEFIYAK